MNNSVSAYTNTVQFFNIETLTYSEYTNDYVNVAEEYETMGISYIPLDGQIHFLKHPQGITENSLRAENGLRQRILYAN